MISFPPVLALVPAAGDGRRMGLDRSKALLRLGGRTVIERTVSTILASSYVEHLTVLARTEDLPAFNALGLNGRRVSVIAGGATRQLSVRCGLEFLRAKFPDIEQAYVLVHDAARCLVSLALVNRTIESCFEQKAVSAGLPLVDSLKRTDSALRVVNSMDRQNLMAVQTPQVFTYQLLYAAHRRTEADATDDASLVEAIHPVQIVLGEKTNLKLTTPEDLEIARKLVEG